MDPPHVTEKSWRNPIAMRRKNRAPAATRKIPDISRSGGLPVPSFPSKYVADLVCRAGGSLAPLPLVRVRNPLQWNENGCCALHVQREGKCRRFLPPGAQDSGTSCLAAN